MARAMLPLRSDGEHVATFGATARKNIATAFGSDAGKKAVLALTLDFAGLIGALDGEPIDARVEQFAVDVVRGGGWRRFERKNRHLLLMPCCECINVMN